MGQLHTSCTPFSSENSASTRTVEQLLSLFKILGHAVEPVWGERLLVLLLAFYSRCLLLLPYLFCYLRSLLLLKLPLLNMGVLMCFYCHIIVLLSHNLLLSIWSYLHPSRTVPTLLLLLFGEQKLRLGSCFLKFLNRSIHPELCLSPVLLGERCSQCSVIRLPSKEYCIRKHTIERAPFS